MKHSLNLKAYIVLFVLTTVSNVAISNIDLARAKNCMSCHTVNRKLIGPAYKDVAIKYESQKDIEEQLVQKVRKGGSGAWGVVPMPANTQVNEKEARLLVKWILSLKNPK